MGRGHKSQAGSEVQGKCEAEATTFEAEIESDPSNVGAEQDPGINPLETGLHSEQGADLFVRASRERILVVDNQNRVTFLLLKQNVKRDADEDGPSNEADNDESPGPRR